MIRVRWLLSSLLAMIVLTHPDAEEASFPSLAPGRVEIINDNPQNINITLRPFGGTWSNVTLQQHENAAYTCDQCNTFEVSITTNNINKNYVLNAQSRYDIEWDSGGFWDIKQVQGR
jgi:hypothetical protein